jgi:DNA adenine methylase
MEVWRQQKMVLKSNDAADELALGFAFFFLNRTNRSGILDGGVIGGQSQDGPWKIDARYNASELISRIAAIAKMRERFSLTNLDAAMFLRSGATQWEPNTLIYCDPPYFVKGRELYYHFYKDRDHEEIADVMDRFAASDGSCPMTTSSKLSGCTRAMTA